MAAILTSPASGAAEFKALTGLRGVAALWVVAMHYMPDMVLCFPQWALLNPLTGKGHLGVDIFFVLSGFILSHVYRPLENRLVRKTFTSFIFLRLARIYPAHLTTLLILICMVGVASICGIKMEGDYRNSLILTNATMTHAWPGIERIPGGAGWNYPSWSVSAEWFAYLFVFPISYFSLQIARRYRIPHELVGYLYLGVLWLAYARQWIPWPTASVMVSLEFLAGCHFYYAWLENKNRWIHSLQTWFPILAVLLVIGAFWMGDSWSRTSLYFSVPLILLGLSNEGNGLSRTLATPLFRWLGIISYSIYLTHALVQKVFVFLERKLVIGEAAFLTRSLFACFMLVTLLVGSAALYYGVEEPIRRWAKRRVQS